MSYRIHYGENEGKKRQTIYVPIAVLLTLLSLINGFHYFEENSDGFREKLMPWTAGEIRAAYQQMCEDMIQGHSMLECIETFCAEIIANDAQDKEN